METPISFSVSSLKSIVKSRDLPIELIREIDKVIATLESLGKQMIRLDTPDAIIFIVAQLMENYAKDSGHRIQRIDIGWIPDGVTKVDIHTDTPAPLIATVQ